MTPVLGWSLPALRRVWNQRKAWCAPWWGENSKEAYNTGLDALARGLEAWSKSRRGQRKGRAVGFPRFKTARAGKSVRFTTGTIRIEADRRHVTLPRLGAIRTHESTRKLAAASRPAQPESCRPRCVKIAPGAGTAPCR
ncbi:putative transposase family protein [Mycobacterium xenopi 4042]|uniref:Putative transposase family protein n=1 Tax=Mycobacterium xenopi 4042 TaxID=1299334 RepID=X7ZG14_MYCXE|nr:putative transposase family protein [Mycobacterium xenopi 4042]